MADICKYNKILRNGEGISHGITVTEVIDTMYSAVQQFITAAKLDIEFDPDGDISHLAHTVKKIADAMKIDIGGFNPDDTKIRYILGAIRKILKATSEGEPYWDYNPQWCAVIWGYCQYEKPEWKNEHCPIYCCYPKWEIKDDLP